MSKIPPFCNVEENEKVIRNPHADPDHTQNLISSSVRLITENLKSIS